MMYILYFFLGLLIIGAISEFRKRSKMSPEELKAYNKDIMATAEWGTLNPVMICSHCQTKGFIRTKSVNRKKGISGGKATGALLTGGFSLLATGLSRKEGLTQAHCCNCNSTWDF